MTEIAPQASPTFTIIPTESVAAYIDSRGWELRGDLDAFREMAAQIEFRLPEAPGMALMNPLEYAATGYRLQDGDYIAVPLPDFDFLTETTVAVSTAITLMKLQHAYRRSLGMRVGEGVLAAGVVGTGAGAATHQPWLEYTGVALMAGGGILTAVAGNARYSVGVPDLRKLPPPVGIFSRSDGARATGQ